MNFECLLLSAKAGNEDAITAILQMYRPLLPILLTSFLLTHFETTKLHGNIEYKMQG